VASVCEAGSLPGCRRVASDPGARTDPLVIDEDEQVTGALDIYAREPDPFDDDSRSAATRFGPYAAVAAGNLYAYRSARDMADNLRIALESRAVIDRPRGCSSSATSSRPTRPSSCWPGRR
jgi:GAF domain-containing protein